MKGPTAPVLGVADGGIPLDSGDSGTVGEGDLSSKDSSEGSVGPGVEAHHPFLESRRRNGERTTVAILGLGLMGASLGMALRNRARQAGSSVPLFVTGWNRTPAVAEKAVERGAVDQACYSVEEAVADAQYVFVATPVSTIPELALRAARAAPRGCIVTDVGSVKARIVRMVEAELPPGVHFVGGHPMCGSELTGLEAARADLYSGSTWVLTPTQATDSGALADLSSLISSVGARVLAVSPDQHDRFVAFVSHLPHVVAAALTSVVAERAETDVALAKLAAGGFRDLTRIASGSPGIWTDICTWNADEIAAALDAIERQLEAVKAWLLEGREESLREFLEDAKEARAALVLQRAPAEDLWEVLVAVPDRPGTLARVTTSVGSRGVNITDVEIVHPLEAGPAEPGVLRLVIDGEREAKEAAEVLRAEGFQVSVGRPTRPGGK